VKLSAGKSLSDCDVERVSVKDLLRVVSNGAVFDLRPFEKKAEITAENKNNSDNARAVVQPPAALTTSVKVEVEGCLTPVGALGGDVLESVLSKALGGREALVALAYSVLLGCLGPAPGQVDSDNLRSIRSRFEISSKRHKALLDAQTLPAPSPHPPGSLQHRCLLLASRTALADFDGRVEELAAFAAREGALLGHGLVALYRSAGASDQDMIVFGSERVTMAELARRALAETDGPRALAAAALASPGGPRFDADGYAAACSRAAKFVDAALRAFPTATAGAVVMAEAAKCAPIPYPLNIELYETLLTALFDPESGCQPVHGFDALHATLRCVRAELRVSLRMDELALARVQFSAFEELREPSLLDAAMARVVNLLDDTPSPDPSVRRFSDAHARALDERMRADVLERMAEWGRDALSDLRGNFAAEPEGLAAAVDCFICVSELRDPEASPVGLLRGVLTNSIQRHVASLLADDGLVSPVPVPELAAFAASRVIKDCNADIKLFGPHFPSSAAVPSAAPLIAGAYLAALRDEVEASMDAGHFDRLDRPSVDILVALNNLEDLVPLEDRKGMPRVYDRFREALVMWAEDQGAKYITFLHRALQAERWEEVGQPPMWSSSLVDLFAMLDQTVPFVFSFKIPRLISVVNSLALKVERVIVEYTSAIVQSTGRASAFIPPPPSFSMSKTKLGGLVAKKAEPPYISPQDEARLTAQTLRRLFVQLNCLHECPVRLAILRRNMEAQFEALRASRRDVGESLAELDLFQSANQSLNESIAQLIAYIGQKCVFFDLRHVFLNGLYVPSVRQARIGGVTAKIDAVLAQVMEFVTLDRTRDVIVSIFKAFLHCHRRVLLDGGPDRIFALEDAQMLDEDIQLIKDLFCARDEVTNECNGLPVELVEGHVGPFDLLLMLFSEDTKALIDQYDSLPQEDSTNNPNTKSNVFRVLVHRRNDPKAKSWVHDRKKAMGM
jgi:hypothetical protein